MLASSGVSGGANSNNSKNIWSPIGNGFPRKLHGSCRHCTKNPIYVLPEMKLCDLAPNSCIHVSVSNLYIPRIGLPI
jgi:hypothetical protein